MKNSHDIRVDLNLLHPWLVYKMKLMLTKCEKQGIYLIITEGYRTKEYQDQLYAKGRFGNPGPSVTNARGSDYASQHQWGVAFDIAINDNALLYSVDYLTRVSKLAKSVGLGWGGDWKVPIDRPHFYLKKWGDTPYQLKQIYKTFENFKSTWTARVVRRNGLNIWTKHFRKKKVLLQYNDTVQVLWKHRIVSKVKYKDTVGYVRSRYIK